MKNIGITGEKGFIGSHLLNHLSLFKDEFQVIPFNKSYFDFDFALENWITKCDVVVHLASLNRHDNADFIYDTNIDLVLKLIHALETTGHHPHLIFSSSTQETQGNTYGKSKKKCRQIFINWGMQNNACITGMIIPNVFGPFGKPHYNSVVATFCYQLCNNHTTVVNKNALLKLIFVRELTEEIITAIRKEKNLPEMEISPTNEIYVSELLKKLNGYKELYFDRGIIPVLDDPFALNLFNTYRSYIDYASYFPFALKAITDIRGIFVEIIKLDQGGQVSFSTTHPGITRGNHFHTRKIERFAVIKGKALIQLRKYNTEQVLNFELDGNIPSYVDMPVWYTHNIKNIGSEELFTVFWINEFFDSDEPDTYFEPV